MLKSHEMNRDSSARLDGRGRHRAAATAAAGALALTLAACGTAGGGRATSPNSAPASSRPSTSEIVPDRGDPQLALLKRYEHTAHVAPQMMEFIGFPQNTVDARIQAEKMASSLQAWSAQHVRPLVIMEPTFNGGRTNMNLRKFHGGDYDSALTTYFSTLKHLGVTDRQLGTWVPFPEPNIPQWDNGVTSPKLFIDNATKVARAIKKEFPAAPISVMLDSQTCDPGWANCATNDVAKLTSYLKFEPGLISSFGFQGCTWDDHDNPATYLSGQTAVICARRLSANHVWFNSGTFSKVDNPNGEGIIAADTGRRERVLDNVLAQAKVVQAAGLTVDFINIFGQDNFDSGSGGTGTGEWQYHNAGALNVLSSFRAAAEQHHIPVSIFDAPGS